MTKRVALTRKQKVDIIDGYVNQLIPMSTLAKQYSISRQGVWKLLNKAGVDTSKKRIPVSCSACGTQIMRTRARVRRQMNHFCCRDCFEAFIRAGNGFPYIQDRQGQRTGRRLVDKHFALQDGHIVHHENRNSGDNRLDNLRVFACQGDHLRHHRGFDVNPIWDGSDLLAP